MQIIPSFLTPVSYSGVNIFRENKLVLYGIDIFRRTQAGISYQGKENDETQV